MLININFWRQENQKVYLPGLMEDLGYILLENNAKYLVYKKQRYFYIVILTSDGYCFYKSHRPGEKLYALDIIEEFVSAKEGEKNENIWAKINGAYKELSSNNSFYSENVMDKVALSIVDKSFNHFLEKIKPLTSHNENIYNDLSDHSIFKNRIFQNLEDKTIFPLFNIDNEIAGLLEDRNGVMIPREFTNIDFGIWYSNVPKKINSILVFSTAKEAIAFHKKFQLENVVYFSLGTINYNTTHLLFEIKKIAKVSKLIVSFTGNKKIEGYVKDLQFISYLQRDNFSIAVQDKEISIIFSLEEERRFFNFYNNIREFNAILAQEFERENRYTDQDRINRQSIRIHKTDDKITVKLPVEVNAIKYMVWNYFKNYLNTSLDILKPKEENWEGEYYHYLTSNKNADENTYSEFRIAL